MARLPRFIRPMLAKPGRPFDSQEHLFEVKWDGIRAMVYRDQDRYRILSRQGRELSDQFPELAFFQELAPGSVLDGELVVLDQGKPALPLVQARQQTQAAEKIRTLARAIPATYIVFDQLFEGYRSLMGQPLMRRRERLAGTVAGAGQERFIVSAGIVGPGRAFYQEVVRACLEGVVAKRLSSRYLPGRRSDGWLKIKWHVRPATISPGHSQAACEERTTKRTPRPVAGFDFAEQVSGELGVGLHLEIEHPGYHEIRPVLKRVGEREPRVDGPGRHHLEGHPGPVDLLHEGRRLLGVIAPHIVVVRVVVVRVPLHPIVFSAAFLGRGRPVSVRVERLHVEIGPDSALLTGLRHLQRVAPNARGHALGPDQVDRLANRVDAAAVHHVFVGRPAVRKQHGDAPVDQALDRVVHRRLVGRQRPDSVGHDLHLRRAILIELEYRLMGGGAGLNRVDTARLGQFEGFEDLGFGVVFLE